MQDTKRDRMLKPYRQEYASRLKDSAEAFGVRPDSAHFTLEGDSINADVTFPITDDLGSYPSAEDVRDRYKDQLLELAEVWDDRNGEIKMIAWSPEQATARACDIPAPGGDDGDD